MKKVTDAEYQMHILYIEDSQRDAEIIRERLIDDGFHFQIDWAATAQEFTAFLQSSKYDLILADYQLPAFDAPAALRLTQSFCPGIPFICVSGAIGEDKAVELLKQGATDFVSKNRLDKLSLAVRRAINEVKERRKHQMAENELRLQSEIMKNVAEGIYLIRLEDGIIVFANPRFEQMFGYDPGEIIGKSIAIVNAPSGRSPEETKKTVVDLLADAGEWHGEIENIKKDATRFWCHANVSMFDHPAYGSVIVSVHTDITEQKQAEIKLRETYDLLASITEGSTDAIYVKDVQGRYLFFNKEAGRVTGKNPAEVIGNDDYFLFPAEEAKCVMAGDRKVMEGKQVLTYEEIVPTSNGTVTFLSTKGPIYDARGGVTGLFGIARNITERKMASDALRKAHDELEQRVQQRTIELQKTHKQLLHAEKMSAVGNLSASIAHEFNNPLQGVMSIIRGVQKRGKFSPEDQELVDLAITECNRMKDLIKSLQDFNRPTSSRKAPMNIHNALDSILLLIRKQFQTKKITVEKKYAEGLPQIIGIADQLKQVFLNLLINASDACECEGGGTITVETVMLGEEVVVRVHDTGIGISPENKARIFDPFFSTKPEVKGVGLGLSVSYGIIKTHGGKITVESQPGKGATFSVILPIEGNYGAEQ